MENAQRKLEGQEQVSFQVGCIQNINYQIPIGQHLGSDLFGFAGYPRGEVDRKLGVQFFKSLKDSSLRARHRARMVLWCIVGYHLTSALRALKVAGGSEVSAISEPYGLRMVVVRRFR